MKWLRQPSIGGSNDETSAEWDEHWKVTGYRPPDGEPAWIGLLAARPELRHGQPHYTPGILARVSNFQWDKLGSTRDAWEVVVSYRQQLAEEEINPLDRPAEIDLDSESVEVPIFEDADGKPILSSAGGLIAGLTEEENHWVFNVAKNIEFMPRWLLDYRNAVNIDVVRIGGLTIEPGYLLLKNPRAGKPQTAEVGGKTVEYRELTFSLVYHPKTWITRVYDRDLVELEESEVQIPASDEPNAPLLTRTVVEPVRIKIKTSDGDEEPIEEPAFLDGRGRRPRNPDGTLKHPLEPEDIVVIERWTKRRLPFRNLPLN